MFIRNVIINVLVIPLGEKKFHEDIVVSAMKRMCKRTLQEKKSLKFLGFES